MRESRNRRVEDRVEDGKAMKIAMVVKGESLDRAGRRHAGDNRNSLPARAKPLILLEAAHFFAKIPCISLQRPASGLHFLF